uniref:SH3 domain containing 19 n=1 Tax=Xiphophorus couchianus TaxID=32473 RepID=A0A3B5MCX7_9TELE
SSFPKASEVKRGVKVVERTAEHTSTEGCSQNAQRPVPRPRTKLNKNATKDEHQTLIRLGENCDAFQSFSRDVPTNKYLEELLEVFGERSDCEEGRYYVDQSYEKSLDEDADGTMSANNNHRNIRARIQAFESQTGTEEDNESQAATPDLPPRRATYRPPVASKPPATFKPNGPNNSSQNMFASQNSQNQEPLTRPKPPTKPVGHSVREDSLPFRLTRSDSVHEEEPAPFPPVPPVKPFKDFVSVRRLAPVGFVPPSGNKSLPPRPPPARTGPGRPAPPSLQAVGRSQSEPQRSSPKFKAQMPTKKGLVLPPRPSPGHRLYNNYMLPLPHGIASADFDGRNSEELTLQKNEVVLLLEKISHSEFDCQIGETRGRVHKSRMTIITPLDADFSHPQEEGAAASGGGADGLKVKALHDFVPEGPMELSLSAGDVVTEVEQVDSQWYRGTCNGSTGFFPISYVKVLFCWVLNLCVVLFEGEHSDELSFSEGDVIQLKEYVGEDWARGQVGASVGIFPLNFVEVIEDLPPPPRQQPGPAARVALPGEDDSHLMLTAGSGVQWAVALYDYAAKTQDELSFQKDDCILITEHLSEEWSSGRLNGREGMFPRAFVNVSSGTESSQQGVKSSKS